MDEAVRIAQRLLDEPEFSRNRHFEELSAPAARRARQILNRLAGLERELRAGDRVEVRKRDGGFVVTIDFPSVRVRRVSYLTEEEHALLTTDRVIGRLLQDATQ